MKAISHNGKHRNAWKREAKPFEETNVEKLRPSPFIFCISQVHANNKVVLGAGLSIIVNDESSLS